MAVIEFPIYWWIKGNWPVVKGQEWASVLMKDLRKFIYLVRNLGAGNIDIIKSYGVSLAQTGSEAQTAESPTWIPFDSINWSVVWGSLVPTVFIEPGQKIVCFKDNGEVIDLYTNKERMDGTTFAATPPIQINGMLDSKWLLYPNPNLYHHFDRNTGRNEIGADGRYFVRYHPAGSGYCTGVYDAYTCKAKGYRWYPRQTDPLAQVIPIKKEGQVIRRYDPLLRKVEIKKAYITENPWSQLFRTRTICTPSLCYPEHKCIRARQITEYVKDASEPKDYLSASAASEIGQDYSDKLLGEDYQSQIIHTCEFQNDFVKKVDDTWIRSFIHFNKKFDWGNFPQEYDRGDIIYVPNWDPNEKYELTTFAICLQDYEALIGTPNAPGTPTGKDYWITPAWQPTLFNDQIEYCRLRDTDDQQGLGGTFGTVDYARHWNANGSPFELVLKMIDPETAHFDWYFDTKYPYVSELLYHEHYHVPGGSKIWNPLPRGCWRRIWKYTMGRPYNLDTGVPFLIWPGEFGYPPGYWEGRGENGAGENDINPIHGQFIIYQFQYDALIASTEKWYRVVDVEGLYEIAYNERKEEIDSLLARHDSLSIVAVGTTQRFELNHELINDMRYVLEQLNMFIDPIAVTGTTFYTLPAANLAAESSGAVYAAGKAFTVNPETVRGNVDECWYRPKIWYDSGAGEWKTLYLYEWHNIFILSLTVDSIYRPDLGGPAETELPKINQDVSALVMNYPYRGEKDLGADVNDAAQIGIEPLCVFPDPEDSTIYYRFLKFPLIEKKWVYDGGADTWYLREYYKVGPHNDWPPDEYFVGGGLKWSRSAGMTYMSGYTIGWNCKSIDYNAFPEDVFKLDKLNFIEV